MAVSQVMAKAGKTEKKVEKPSLVSILSKEMASFIIDRYRKLKSFARSTTSYTATWWRNASTHQDENTSFFAQTVERHFDIG